MSKVGDKGEYIQCRLVDENGKAVRGEVILGGVRVTTAEDGGFTLSRNKYAASGVVFGQAFSSDGDLGCLFIWGENYDANNDEKTNHSQSHACTYACVAVGFRHSFGGRCRDRGPRNGSIAQM